jgi:NADH-quinone oxidoreductase subunit G
LAAHVGALTQDWHGFNVLHTAAGRVGALDLGFLPGPNGKAADAMLAGGVDLLWLLGADGFDPARIAAGTFVVYQGHHGDAGAQRADVILPGAAYTEKSATYVNTEGRAQRGFRAVYPPGDAREDWTILRAFSAVIGKTLPYDTIEAVRARLEQVNPVFGRVGSLNRFGCTDHTGPVGDPAVLSDAPLTSTVANYYVTDPISRSSPTMAACVEAQATPAPTDQIMAAE